MTRNPSSLGLVLGLAVGLSACSSHRVAEWVPDPPASTPAVSLRVVQPSRTELRVQVVARDVRDLYGIAYRITFDPAVLRFVSQAPAEDYWPAASARLDSAVVPVAAPGQLVAAITRRGDVPGVDTGAEQVLAELVFQRTEPERASPLGFVAARSACFDASGTPLPDVSFVGGQLRR